MTPNSALCVFRQDRMKLLLPDSDQGPTRRFRALTIACGVSFLIFLGSSAFSHFSPPRYPHGGVASELSLGLAFILLALNSVLKGKGPNAEPSGDAFGIVLSFLFACGLLVHGAWTLWKHG
jgi:hypothetical protein